MHIGTESFLYGPHQFSPEGFDSVKAHLERVAERTRSADG